MVNRGVVQSGAMDDGTRLAVDLVLRDMRATCDVQPLVEARDGEIWFFEADGSGCGIGAEGTFAPAEAVRVVADQASEWAVEHFCNLGLPATWPECPVHPRSHPLMAEVLSEVASWCCPRTATLIAPIGALQRRH